MTATSCRTTRLAWLWCVAYTAIAPGEPRERRRDEIRSHLWESEQARLSPVAVGWAALRGAGSDLVWAVTCGVPALMRSCATPTPYVVLAPAFPIQAWIVSSLAVGSTAQVAQSVGAFGGLGLLVVAGVIWLARRS